MYRTIAAFSLTGRRPVDKNRDLPGGVVSVRELPRFVDVRGDVDDLILESNTAADQELSCGTTPPGYLVVKPAQCRTLGSHLIHGCEPVISIRPKTSPPPIGNRHDEYDLPTHARSIRTSTVGIMNCPMMPAGWLPRFRAG